MGLVLVLRGPEQWAACLCFCSHSPVPALSWCPVPLCLGLTLLLLFPLAWPGSLRVSNAPSSFPQPLRPGRAVSQAPLCWCGDINLLVSFTLPHVRADDQMASVLTQETAVQGASLLWTSCARGTGRPWVGCLSPLPWSCVEVLTYSVSLTSQGGRSWTCLGSHRQWVPEQGHSCNLMLGGLLINIYGVIFESGPSTGQLFSKCGINKMLIRKFMNKLASICTELVIPHLFTWR